MRVKGGKKWLNIILTPNYFHFDSPHELEHIFSPFKTLYGFSFALVSGKEKGYLIGQAMHDISLFMVKVVSTRLSWTMISTHLHNKIKLKISIVTLFNLCFCNRIRFKDKNFSMFLYSFEWSKK